MTAQVETGKHQIIPTFCHGCGAAKPRCAILCHVKMANLCGSRVIRKLSTMERGAALLYAPRATPACNICMPPTA